MSEDQSIPLPPPPPTPLAAQHGIPQKRIDSRELLEGHTEVLIHHDNEIYRLRLTRNGKLILQK